MTSYPLYGYPENSYQVPLSRLESYDDCTFKQQRLELRSLIERLWLKWFADCTLNVTHLSL